ncbi:hypothetical protein EB670_24775 (plasmid) [Escherichia coli]|nr:hypothetical protein EB670_24775 [Escherichia coli]MCH6987068.1 hypothetical protein [Escherichia coli]
MLVCVPSERLAVLGAEVGETSRCGGDRAWSAIVEPCALVGSHGANEHLALVDAVPDLPAVADADQERGDERGRAIDSPACVDTGTGFPLPVPAGDAQTRPGLVGGNQAVCCAAAARAKVAGFWQGSDRGFVVLLNARPERKTDRAPATLEVGVVDALVLVAALVHLSACFDAKAAPAGAGHEQDAGELFGEFFSRAYALKCCRVWLRRFVRVVIVVHCSPCVEMVANPLQHWICWFFIIA